jgi:UMP-CMP kinase
LKGEIVPVDITVKLIKDAMKKAGWAEKRFLIDGFPRNEDNQEGWVRVMGDEVNMEFVLFLDCTEDLMVARILKRASDAGENARNDDNEETLRKRFRVF